MSEFAGKSITCRAAVCWGAGEELKVEIVEVAPPQKDEVRIKIVASGVCFSDIAPCVGKLKSGFPLIPGHEAAGIVESVGEEVTHLSHGDHVMLCFLPQCNKCPICKRNQGNFCPQIVSNGTGLMPDGSSRFKCKGEKVYTFTGTSSFSEYTVVRAGSCVKIDQSAPLKEVCLLACGVPTGYGGAVNTANVQPGSICAVFGLGTIGLAAVMGCRDAKASKIIGIDINPDKFPLAEELGVTDCINPKELSVPIEAYLMQTYGGIDYSIECIGSILTMKQAFDCTKLGKGTCCLLGVSPSGAELPVIPINLQMGRILTGSFYGGYRPQDDIPKLVNDYQNFSLRKLITHEMPLDKINEAVELLKMGKSIRTVITF